MVELCRTNDAVLLSWLVALLAEAKVHAVVLDTHTSVLEGSLGVLPRRLMVADSDFEQAQTIMREADVAGA